MRQRPGLNKSGTGFDLPNKQTELQSLEKKMSRQGFWDNQDAAQATVSRLSALKAMIEPVKAALVSAKDLQELFELAVEENDAETLEQIEKDLQHWPQKAASLSIQFPAGR